MRTLFIITLMFSLSLLFMEQVKAQRYFPNLVGVQLKGGLVDGVNKENFSFGIAINTYTYSAHQWVFGAEYLQKKHDYKDIRIPVEQYTMDVGYYYTVLVLPSRTFYLLGDLSGMVGYERINKGKKILFDGARIENKDSILFGGAVTLELETFLSDKFILTLTARERVLFGSTTGKFHF